MLQQDLIVLLQFIKIIYNLNDDEKTKIKKIKELLKKIINESSYYGVKTKGDLVKIVDLYDNPKQIVISIECYIKNNNISL